jgi:hypothetical protein
MGIRCKRIWRRARTRSCLINITSPNNLGEAVDRVRRREQKVLKAEGDDRLMGTKYQCLRSSANLEDAQRREFAQLVYSELKTARAWALNEEHSIGGARV